MSKNKLTPWFKVGKDGQPKRKGWYEIKWQGDPSASSMLRFWDGSFWNVKTDFGVKTCQFGNNKIGFPDDAWRGLAEKP